MTDKATFWLEADRAELTKAVKAVLPALVPASRTVIPILGCVKLSRVLDRFRVSATDMDVLAEAEFKAWGEGEICLPGRRLAAFLSAVPDAGKILMRSDEAGVVRIMAGEVSATIFSASVGDFPDLKAGDATWMAPLAEGVFGYLVGGVAHAISREETRYYLNGICLEVKDGKMISVATDGHRLAAREQGVDDLEDQARLILPRKAVDMSAAMVGKGEAIFYARGAYAEILPSGADGRILTKLIDATYPDWRRVVPAPTASFVELEVKALRRGLRAMVKVNSADRARATILEASGGKAIKLSSKDPDNGEVSAVVEATITGPVERVGFNGRYLDQTVAGLERQGAKRVRLHITGGGNPMLILSDNAPTTATDVLMPMRV